MSKNAQIHVIGIDFNIEKKNEIENVIKIL